MSGLVVAGTAGVLGVPLDANAELVLALVGMCACFNVVVRAPMTAVLIVFELTERYDVVPALISCLADPKPGIRAAAAASLGSIGGEPVIEALKEASHTNNPILAGIIKNALMTAERKK